MTTTITENNKQNACPATLKHLWKNKFAAAGFIIIVFLIIVTIFSDNIAPYSPYQQNFESLLTPSKKHLFGTDKLGQDVFCRVVYGARISLSIGFLATSITVFIGVILGIFAGYLGGIIDTLIMRLCDFLFAIPGLLLAIGIMVTIGPGYKTVLIALSSIGWAGIARLIRGTVLSLKEEDFIQAAKSIGAGSLRIMFVHILPNCISPIIVIYTIGVAGAIMGESALSFLGIGIVPPTPSWGSMVSLGADNLRNAPWTSLFAGAAIALTVFAFNMLGDGLRDVLDPKMKN